MPDVIDVDQRIGTAQLSSVLSVRDVLLASLEGDVDSASTLLFAAMDEASETSLAALLLLVEETIRDAASVRSLPPADYLHAVTMQCLRRLSQVRGPIND